MKGELTRKCTPNGLDFYICVAALLFLSPSWKLLSLYLSIQFRLHKELIACKFISLHSSLVLQFPGDMADSAT
jgi:hypothetical protein